MWKKRRCVSLRFTVVTSSCLKGKRDQQIEQKNLEKHYPNISRSEYTAALGAFLGLSFQEADLMLRELPRKLKLPKTTCRVPCREPSFPSEIL